MPLTTGTRLGPYEIIAPLGAGGMGEVYRARDGRLQRDVALKVLPELLAADAERLARFEREAQLLASLSHPNIAIIHGVEDSSGVRALVLELVEGPTLEDRVRQGPVPLEDALRIAQQLVDALDAAHANGIVHRDLKPSNIKLRPDGTVKVLDFGLAKVLEPVSVPSAVAEAPTITSPAATRQGMILGTAAYMSPEQARGQTVDRRADIWAFGCVLYEMLTGRRAFAAQEVSDTLAFVIMKEPDWTSLPAITPAPIQRLLRRSLQKDSRRRLADIADARLEIEDAQSGAPAASLETAKPRPHRERLAWISAVTTLALVALAAMAWALRPVPQLPEMRVDITAPPTNDPVSLAISPDGQKIVFVAASEGRSRLWVRSLNAVSARPLPGTDNARLPFWSPDNRSLGFSAEAQLKVIDLESGSVRALANAPVFLGGTWSANGDVLFVADANTPVSRISASGGEPTVVTRLEPGHLSHIFPHFLPDGRRFLYYIAGAPEVRGVHIGSVGEEKSRRLLDAESAAMYAPSGHLFFLRQGTAFAQSFDPVRLETTGNPVPVAEEIARMPFAAALIPALSVSAAGPVVYRSGPPLRTRFQFAWFDRSGKEIRKLGESVNVALNPSMSPDEHRVATFRDDGRNFDIWMLDTGGGAFNRFTFDPGVDFAAVWSPDGSRLAISSNRKGVYDLYEKSATGAGTEELLLATEQNKTATDWSPDGQLLLYRSFDPKGAFDIWALPLKERTPFPVVRTSADERNAQFSPDGKWIAYQSNESGRFEIWVQPFSRPGTGRSGKWQISTAGGAHVRWRRDGRELFYVAPDGLLMAVPIRIAPDGKAIETGAPQPLFSAPSLDFARQGTILPAYMVSRDGQRFLINTVPVQTIASPMTLILNWRRP
jgi:serine/threonine protein kinase